MQSSIAVTTYNGREYIAELLDSIYHQTRKPDEIIIIDDASTDDTVSIVNKYIENRKLSNWRIIKNESNIGWKKNFRKAMGMCSGDIILFCDQDDIWHKDKIEIMCNIMENNKDVKVLVSNYVLLSQGNKQARKQNGSERDDGKLEKISGDKRIGTISRPGCTFAFTREIAELMTIYDNMDCSHDHVVYNLGLITDSLYIVNRQLIDFRRHQSNASTYRIKFGKERKALEAKDRVEICNILLNYCKKENDIKKEVAVGSRREFYLERNRIFENGSLLEMMKFVINNTDQYLSAREIAVDLIAMTK